MLSSDDVEIGVIMREQSVPKKLLLSTHHLNVWVAKVPLQEYIIPYAHNLSHCDNAVVRIVIGKTTITHEHLLPKEATVSLKWERKTVQTGRMIKYEFDILTDPVNIYLEARYKDNVVVPVHHHILFVEEL